MYLRRFLSAPSNKACLRSVTMAYKRKVAAMSYRELQAECEKNEISAKGKKAELA